jgi:hypothetical protein
MKSDATLALLTRENPVHEDDLPGPESVAAYALKQRILLDDATFVARGRNRRLPRSAFCFAVAGIAAAAVAFGVLSVLPGSGPSAVARAAAVLNPADGTILHTVVVTTSTNPDGSSSTGRTESWRQQSPPYDERSVTEGRETAMADGRPEAYIPSEDTLHVLPPEAELPPSRGSAGTGNRLLDNIRRYLASGEARTDGTVTVNGREAVRIIFAGSQSPAGSRGRAMGATYLVDAQTYEPIELRDVGDDGTVVTSRFVTYESLPATAANLALLSLRKQHPGATVVQDVTVEGFGPDPAKGT